MNNHMFTQWLKPFARRYGLDLRSLALLRVGLALIILSDLWFRCGDLLAHYSDRGVANPWLCRQIFRFVYQCAFLNTHPV